MSACARLGISVQPARVYQATDKAALERFFRTLREQLLAALPGYKGPDVAARAGFLQVPARPDLVFDFLKLEWRTVQHYGVEIGGLRYDGPALNGHRNQTSPYGGEHAGRWPVRVDPGDVSRVWFQDPDDGSWHARSRVSFSVPVRTARRQPRVISLISEAKCQPDRHLQPAFPVLIGAGGD